MDKIEIAILQSANGVKFGSTPANIHKAFGDDFENFKDKKLSSEDKNFLTEVAKKFSEMSGRPISSFMEYFEEDNEFDYDPCDYYSFCLIDYDDNDKFNAISIYSDQGTQLIVDGKDFSSFDLQKLLTLADDFEEKENKTSYISNSKQIGIWCPDGDGRVESILFGCPGYYDSLNDL